MAVAVRVIDVRTGTVAATAIGQGAASRRKVGFGGLGAGPRRAYCSSSPYGEGCGPGMMPAMSGSSPVAAWGFDARRILASSRRAAFWFRFSICARSRARLVPARGLARFRWGR